MDRIDRIIQQIFKQIFKIERTIYCLTNCKIELPLHKSYYRNRRLKYEDYIKQKEQSSKPKCI